MNRHLFLVVEVSDGGNELDPSLLGKALDLAADGFETCRFLWSGIEHIRKPVPFMRKILSRQRKAFKKDVERFANSVQVTAPGFKKGLIDYCSRNGISLNLLHPFPVGLGPSDLDALMLRASKSEAGFAVSYPVHSGNVDALLTEFMHFNRLGISVSLPPVYPGRPNDWGYSPPTEEGYITAMGDVFDAWISDGNRKVYVQPFTGHLAFLSGSRDPSDCPHNSCLMDWLSIRADGSVHPCGKRGHDTLRLGDIAPATSLKSFFDTDPFQGMLRDSVERRRACSPCDVYAWCNGGCSMDALDSGDMSRNGGFSCVVDRAMFLRTASFFEDAFSARVDPRDYPEAVADALLKRAITPKAAGPAPIVPNDL